MALATTVPGYSREAATGPLLEVRSLSAIYPIRGGAIHAVSDVSFEVSAGETVGIVGETGCGKSTMVRALIGLMPSPGHASAGEAFFHGRDLLKMKGEELRRVRAGSVAFMPQNSFGALNPVTRLDEQFRNIIRLNRSASSRQCREIAADLLKQVGIIDPARVLNGYVHQLSGGMAQRVVIAMTMVRDPEIIIADEPTTGLDLTVLRQIMGLLVRLRQERGAAMLLVTHALGVVSQYCNRVIVMYAGQVVEIGPVGAVFKDPRHPYTQALLGSVPRRGEQLSILAGAVPTLREPLTTCAFRDRCQFRSDPRCEWQRPPLREVGPDHWAATFCDVPSTGEAPRVVESAAAGR